MLHQNMSLKCVILLVSSSARFSGLKIDIGAWIWLLLQVLAFDMSMESLLFPENLVAWWKLCAVKLGCVYVFMTLQHGIGRETFVTSLPIACKNSHSLLILMGVLNMSL